jgi:hypothetical protein
MRPVPVSTRSDFDPRSTPGRTTRSISELDVQLKLALAAFDRTENLFQRHAISGDERENARGNVLRIAAELEGLDDAFNDEIERLKMELRRKNAEREKAEAQTDAARTIVARNKRLNERKPGMVAEEDVAKSEAELRITQAQTRIVVAEIDEVGLRIRQLRRRQERLKEAVGLADRVKPPPAPGRQPTGEAQGDHAKLPR